MGIVLLDEYRKKMKTHNEIGFNNFKSFGEKIQTFTQKPITLIYGPNSVGKSSLLHFLLYAEYLKDTGSVNLEKTDFAGDPIDLGGFSNFIHQKNTTTKIGYQLTFRKEPDIDEYFSPLYTVVRDFERQGAFATEIQIGDIKKRIQTYRKKKKNALIIYSPMVKRYNLYSSDYPSPFMTKDLKKTLKELNSLTFDTANMSILPSEQKEQEKILQNCIETFDSLENILKREDSKQFDGLDKLILFIIDYKELNIFGSDQGIEETVQTVWDLYRFLSRIKDIRKIKIEFEFGTDSKKDICNYSYFLDNELIYTYDSKTKKFFQNNNCSILKTFEKSGFFRLRNGNGKNIENPVFVDMLYPRQVAEMATAGVISNFITAPEDLYFPLCTSLSDICNSIHYRITSSLKTNTDHAYPQYLGPIRFYPERINLVEQNFKRLNTDSEDLNDQKGFKFSRLMLFVRSHSPILFKILLLFELARQKYLGKIFKNSKILDHLNRFRKHKNKISSKNSMNSEKMWSMFIQSDSSQKNVNKWFLKDPNLKLPYRIETKKIQKNKLIRKLFRLKPAIFKKLVFIDTRNNTRVTPREMGLGVSQVLPILIAAQTLKNYKIFIEQPELHLHPAIQCEVADEIIRSMKFQKNEFIIESHSEHLLLRIMKRIRQTSECTLKNDEFALTPDDICLLYVDNNGKMAYINELELDAEGSLLDPWPNGFFEEGFKERFI